MPRLGWGLGGRVSRPSLREPDLSGTAASSIFLRAHLPQDKQEALAALDEVISNFSDREEKALHARRASMLSV